MSPIVDTGTGLVRVRFTGLEEYFAKNEGAKAKVKASIAAALFKTAEGIRDEAKARAPRRKGKQYRNGAKATRGGALARGVWARVKVTGDTVTARVSPRKRQFYGRFVEEGVKEKKVPVRMYVRSDKGGGREQASRRRQALVMHWGARGWRKVITGGDGIVRGHMRRVRVKAQPFMNPAFMKVRDLVAQRVVEAASSAMAGDRALLVRE